MGTKNANHEDRVKASAPFRRPTKGDVARFRVASRQFQSDMKARGITEEQLAADFERRRNQR